MQIFIDESGSFSWSTPAISLFVSLIIPDRSMDILRDRFSDWRKSIIGDSARELKGSELTALQLESVVGRVLPNSDRDPKLTVVGADTSTTQEVFVEKARDQLSEQFAHMRKLLLDREPPNKTLAQAYEEMSGWTRNRSAVNFLWIWTAQTAILQAVQCMVCYFMEPEDDDEFENIEISIDKAFIKEKRPVEFWIEFLRLGLSNHSKEEAFITPNTWRNRDHPFNRKYDGGGYRNFTDLYRNHMGFVDSKLSVGVQIADICAQICRRYHRGEVDLPAYNNLKRRIVGPGGVTLTLKHFDQACLHSDGVEKHVKFRTIEQMRDRVKSRTPDG